LLSTPASTLFSIICSEDEFCENTEFAKIKKNRTIVKGNFKEYIEFEF
jgi:hypothetical protein